MSPLYPKFKWSIVQCTSCGKLNRLAKPIKYISIDTPSYHSPYFSRIHSHQNLYTNTPTLNINISTPNTRYAPPLPINSVSTRNINLYNKPLSQRYYHPTRITRLYKRPCNALEMYVSDMNEIDYNRSKEFNISRNRGKYFCKY